MGADTLESEFDHGRANLAVGTSLLFENDRVRVWEVKLAPGERAPVHCHATDYFWTCVEGGKGQQHAFDSRTGERTFRELVYTSGQTTFATYGQGSYVLHDLENCGQSEIRFVTVELKS